jgi:hypothetical protein
MTRRPAISTSWSEGRYCDRWTIVHFLCGVSGGFSNALFGLSVEGVYAVGSGLMIVWELIEVARGIGEALENRVVDVLIGIVGIFCALWIAPRVEPSVEYAALAISGVAFGVGNLLGWLAYRRRVRQA